MDGLMELNGLGGGEYNLSMSKRLQDCSEHEFENCNPVQCEDRVGSSVCLKIGRVLQLSL